jgi:putative ABC transport system permease protein
MRDLRFWRWRRAEDDDLDRELQVHLELATEERLEAGTPLREAQLAAHKKFGSVALTKEELRDMRAGAILDRLGRELRHAARRLLRSPAFALATVLTLALAIAANVAIFTLVQRVILNPLPYGDPGRLLALNNGAPVRSVSSGINLSLQLYYQYLDRARTLDGLALYRVDERTLTGAGVPERVRVARTTPSLAPVLRVNPEQGRWFAEEEGAPGVSPVAAISHGFWTRRYGNDPNVIGRTLVLDGTSTTVIGVMRPSFAFPDPRVDIWIPDPMSRTMAASPAVAGVFDYSAIARLRQGATLADARAELTRLTHDLAPISPGNGYDQMISTATTLIDAMVGRVAHTLWFLLAAVGLVLIVACANVANLFMVRSDAKQREVAVRRALGAGSGGIAGYFFAESAWLALAGGALGLALAWAAVHLVVAFGPSSLPRLHEVRIDDVTIAFTVALSLATATACGAIPLLRLGPLSVSLRESARSHTLSRTRHRARHVLMSGQVALALVLLVSSGLMLRSFQKLRAIDPGFDARSALTFRVGLPPADYPDRERMVVAYRAILDRLSQLPGVTSVSAATCLPLSTDGCFGGPLFVEGRVLPPGAQPPLVRYGAVAGGFFETTGTRVVRGRSIDRRDVDRREAVAVVDETLVKIAFPNQDPIGQRIRMGNPSFASAFGWLTIVGVVGNTPTRALAEPTPVPKMYMPLIGARIMNIVPPLGAMSYVLRSTVPPQNLTAAARRAVTKVDPKLAIAQVVTLQDILDLASAQMAFTMVLLAIAAAVALLLGVVGIYGAMSYIVSQRTGEIGIRLALGAVPGSVARMIVRQGGLVALAGITVGLGSAFAGSRLIQSLLYGVSPRDPGVFAGTTVLLIAVVLLACWLPARRAARLSPLDALRAE